MTMDPGTANQLIKLKEQLLGMQKQMMELTEWIKSWFKFSDDRCHNCGHNDDELNICCGCGKTTCDGCIIDSISGLCINCEG